jgi:predicted nucleotide-binding protein (sugar kinase/HSP70/actin superfamily)
MGFRKIMQQENEIWTFGKIDGANFIANADIRFALDIIE